MLRRSFATLALCALAGCQNYNFNPVGKCVIQPGSRRVEVGGAGTADVLFVVDDSGSMASEQASLARNFGSFVNALAQTQQQRAATGLQPFEFHIAITTSSIFEGWLPSSGSPTCSGQPLQCAISASRYTGQPASLSCSDQGAACDDLVENYFPNFTLFGCSAGIGTAGAAYPQGSFVAAPGNPSVLHFTKDVWAGTTTATASLATLSTQFQQNINVGTCGSGMEQHFEAGLLAVQKALAGQQPNTKADEWPHAGAKMVVVWIGDEDDCSNPNDPTKALAFDPHNGASSNPGADVCIADQLAATHKMFPLDKYVSYFGGLGRDFGAAFIYSADPTSCQTDPTNPNIRVCKPGTCTCQCPASCASCGPTAAGACNIPSDCSGKIPALAVPGGSRYAELSSLFRGQGKSTFEGSVCDADWGTTLKGIAQLVTPKDQITLPTQPAASEVALLRIESADGKTSRYCTGPATTQAELTTDDWYFVDCSTGAPVLSGTTTCIKINHATQHCEPNAGESYVAQYLGVVPSPTDANPLGGCDPTKNASDCQTFLGGALTDWQCTPIGTTGRGTCTCAGTQ